MKLVFEKGNPGAPSGNLVLYCHVKGDNPLQNGAGIIASNIIVSFLHNGENLPAITFPPIPYQDFQELKNILEIRNDYDLLKIDDFCLPADPGQSQEYVNKRLEEVNEIVKKYVELCSRWMKNRDSLLPGAPNDDSEVIEKINYLEEMFDSYRTGRIGDQQSRREFIRYFQNFLSTNPQYPLKRLMDFMDRKGNNVERLLDLYFRQSRAIYFENYEEAMTLQSEISRLNETIR